MMHPAVTMEDWSLMDCQEYFVDLEMSLAGVATARSFDLNFYLL
jgi:hypothetical protein